ncbi:hypothetical protein [Microbacterium murale]|uniref:Uncharacterized protein n=1 Tax=Microbacterium murale TaxID=1081040 RepID=A0ABU0P3Y7_9MICO|nr:hypothetical protein [Microbacterium murale]MDQ0642045.1 hypothetical protein [Microbacterium murale]
MKPDETAVDSPADAASAPSKDPVEKSPPTLDQRFRFAGTDFTDSFDALRETHTELSGAAANLDKLGSIWENLPPGVELTRDEKQRLITELRSIPPEDFSARTLLDKLWEVTADDAWGPAFTTTTMTKFFRPLREPIFHGALLISAVASLEAHLGLLAENYYRAAPVALHAADSGNGRRADQPKEAPKEFSLKDLQTLGSIDQAIEAAIEARVSKLSYGSLSDWRKFFDDRMNIDMAEQGTPWQEVLEVFERRHCLVHSEGRASERYVKATKASEPKADLRPDREYVSSAIDALQVVGTLLQAAVWRKFTKNHAEIYDQLEMIAFGALNDERWAFALPLYERCRELPLTNEEVLMTTVNIWLARKGMSGVDSIRDEVEQWDVSGVDELYVFAKACILDDVDSAFAQLPTLVERKKLSGAALATWPLTAPLRADPRIREYGELVRGYLSTEIEESELAAEAASDPTSDVEVTAEAPPEGIADTSSAAVSPEEKGMNAPDSE